MLFAFTAIPLLRLSKKDKIGGRIHTDQTALCAKLPSSPNFEVYVSNSIIKIDFSYSYVSETEKNI